MDAYLILQSNHVEQAATLVGRARAIVSRTGDPGLDARVGLIESYCRLLAGDDGGRASIVEILKAGPPHIDEIYSAGYSNLTYYDVEQRRLGQAADMLERSIPLMEENDLPICSVWQRGSRAGLGLLTGDWERAKADADRVLDGPSAPLARTWPLVIRALVAMREVGSGTDDLDETWRLACRFGEPMRMLPAAAAVAEWVWLTGNPDERLEECVRLYETAPPTGLEWTRGDLAVWLRRAGRTVDATGVAEPYQLVLDGKYAAAADRFDDIGTPYDAALFPHRVRRRRLGASRARRARPAWCRRRGGENPS